MSKSTKNSFERAKDFIIKAGFSHIKIEMEADLGREEEDDSYECDNCYGEGYVDCSECQGSGVVMASRPNGTDIEVECDECNSESRIECDECDGSGNRESNESWDCDRCEEYIKDYVSDEARQALTYSRFYYDGSVDSEMTLTLPVKNAEYLVEYLEAFRALGEEIGNGIETGGAGLHLAVIPACSNGYYPAPADSLSLAKWRNFKSEVTKLLPALYMLASAGSISRELGYRTPQVSSTEKYSAIYASHRSSLEYRLFETCYDNPETVKEYVEVIAKTLKFYHNPNLKVTPLEKTFDIADGDNNTSRFYQTPEKISILRTQLKYIRPEGKSISQLMKSRDVPNITELKKLQSAKKKQLRKSWFADKKRIETLKKQPLTDRQVAQMKDLIAGRGWCGPISPEKAELEVRGIYREMPNLIDYLNQNLSGGRNGYSVAV